VDTCLRNHVLTQVVRADIHQLDRVEGAAPIIWVYARMSGAAMETECGFNRGQHICRLHGVYLPCVPRHAYIYTLEVPVARHEALGRAALFGGAAVEANRTLDVARLNGLLDGGRGGQAGDAKKVVAAAVTVATDFQGLGVWHLVLAQTRQGVVLAQ